MAGGKQNRQQQEVTSVQQIRQWSAEERAAAVARVAAGESVHAVARDLGVQPVTVRRWREAAGLHGPGADPGDPQQQRDYAALVLRHLELGLAAAERILGQTADAGWLGKQSAGELATLYGVIFDKQARILAALPAPGDGGADQVDTRPPPGLPAPGGADPTSVEYRPG